MSTFLDKIKNRRTIYAIGKNVALDRTKIEETIREAVKHSPSAFNSQSSRVVTLYGESHAKFWNLVREALHKLFLQMPLPVQMQRLIASLLVLVQYYFMKIKLLLKACKSNLNYMQITSQFGLNIQVQLLSLRLGLRFQNLV